MSKIRLAAKNQIIVKALTPQQKASKTARWARIMAKWLITYAGGATVKWRFIEFGGTTGSESRGIVDFLAVRKNHHKVKGLNRGDLLDLILIQTKGGSAPRPTASDAARLKKVAEHHRAKASLLVEWKRGKSLEVYLLNDRGWTQIKRPELVSRQTSSFNKGFSLVESLR